MSSQHLYIYQMDAAATANSSLASNKTLGPITFRTWDFAGQKEYYTTHQYFISKRALYLVCWKLSDEEKGIGEIHHWLSNIQTRAPGSPVILVGTHQDQLAKLKNYKEISNHLQRCIYERFVQTTTDSDSSSAAFPPIMASVEVSSKTGFNIKALARLVYDVAAQMRVSGVKDQLLLEQKIPVTYLALEESIGFVVHKLRTQGRNPVLNTSDYLKEIRFAVSVLYPDEEGGEKVGGAAKEQSRVHLPGVNLNELIRSASKNSHIKKEKLMIRFRDDAEILQVSFFHMN
jgi:GTPase SAR1 family protein